MKCFFENCINAFGMFSSLPMPFVEWTEKNTKYMLLCFPLVGVFLGLIFALSCYLLDFFAFSNVFSAVLLTLTPLAVTGGIHMDGYCDTIDARSSHQSTERKRAILSDPHVGAFALITVVCYMMLYVAVMFELEKTTDYYPVFVGIFTISRCCSGLATLLMPKAKNEGLAQEFSLRSYVKCVVILLFSLIVITFLLCFTAELAFIFCIVYAVLLLNWNKMCMKEFGGVTGDLAGYLLQKLELYGFVTVLIYQKIEGMRFH